MINFALLQMPAGRIAGVTFLLEPLYINSINNFKACDFVLKPESFNSSSYNLNKIRPISISNCLAQIKEKLIEVNYPEPNKVNRFKIEIGTQVLTSLNMLLELHVLRLTAAKTHVLATI
ncbi:hypothetical protein BpHYR1_014397 [Brachionus plicatilis]|uniref:Uncharacterized protein n=1 Tax=Brachionus plicatilis TaxID=10195 RepID=A0A3M7R2I4_BRAPC|nr:hypothetical protein BpHYR1_014397 [Brachionus plicatilis]